MPNILFSEEFLGQFERPGNPFERSYIKLLSTKESLGILRDRIERLLLLYPASDRDRMISLIRSFDDVECFSALAELYAFENIYNIDHGVAIEPTVEEVEDRTPDFVTQKYVFEVASLHKKANTKYSAIIEAINTIDTDYKIVLRGIDNIPENAYPKISEVRNAMINLFNEYNRDRRERDSFYLSTEQGITIYGLIYRGTRGTSIVQSVFESYGFQGEDEQYRRSIRRTIKKKIKKYRSITQANKKLVIILYNYNDWLDEEEFLEILYGDEVLVYNQETPEIYHTERRNVLIRPDQNRGVSAILIKKYSSMNNYYIVRNKYSENQLAEDEITEIVTAFNCEDISI